MTSIEVKRLIDELDSVDFREFWWGSPLLARAARARSPEVVRALLVRHHCLENKRADSCHVIREAIKRNDGTELPTLWEVIAAVSDPDSLPAEIDDHYSLPWSAAYVLGEIGGRPALGKVTGKLELPDPGWQYLFVRIAMHLLVRYAHVMNPEEPEVEGVDVHTGRAFRRLMREAAPDLYERTMLRRRQENELFVPVDPGLLPDLIRNISAIDDSILPCDRNQLSTLVRMLPRD